MRHPWTEEHDNTLRSMWGRYRAARIGLELGMSKNAVIGRARRLGLDRLSNNPVRIMPAGIRMVRERRVRKNPFKRKASLKPEVHIVPIVEVESLNIPFMDLAPQHCRFPTSGEGHNTLFCGHGKVEGTSYCAWHGSIVFTAPMKISREESWRRASRTRKNFRINQAAA